MLTGIAGYASSIQYHPNLMLKQLVNGNNVTWTQQIADGQSGRPLDAMARLYSIGITGASTAWSLGPYAYDGAGNIKSVTAGALSETYVYDKVLRMTSGTIVTGGVNRTQTAAYSPYGFITSLTTNGSGQSFTETAGTNRISGASYNAAGSMTGWGSYSYTWDPLNQMASTYGSGFTKRTFLYTADGERIEERVASDPLNPSSIVVSARGLDGKVLRLLTKNGTWSWTKDYVYRDGAQVASIESAGTKYVHLDHLGTVRRITNTASPAAIIASHDYYPFGLEATSPSQDSERMKWTGHERDQQGTPSVQTDDLDYMHARFENFNIGRFLSIDPVRGNPKRPQSFNLFAYARNNPINLTDPLGLLPQSATADGTYRDENGNEQRCTDEDKDRPECKTDPQPNMHDEGDGSDSPTDSERFDRELLGQLIFAEGRGEDRIGMELIAAVVIERAEPGHEWPDTISGVVCQTGQFQGVDNRGWRMFADPRSANGLETAAMERARLAADAALSGRLINPGDATFFSSRVDGKVPEFFMTNLGNGRFDYLYHWGAHDFWRYRAR